MGPFPSSPVGAGLQDSFSTQDWLSPFSCKELELQVLLGEIVFPRGGGVLVSIILSGLHGGVLRDTYFGLTIRLYVLAGS